VKFPEDRVDRLATTGRPWVLEPDRDHLVELLQLAARTPPAQRRERGASGRAAAQALSWDAVATKYAERISALSLRHPRLAGALPAEPFPLTEEVDLR